MFMCICMLTKRAQILFDEGLWKKLVQLAQAQKTSVGQIIRETIMEKYGQETNLSERKQLLEEIENIRPKPLKGRIDYKALINYGRKY